MVGLDYKEPAKTTDSLWVKAFTGVGPLERMSERSIPGFDEVADRGFELINGIKVIVFEALVFEDTKPYLNQVEPGGMERKKVNHNALVL